MAVPQYSRNGHECALAIGNRAARCREPSSREQSCGFAVPTPFDLTCHSQASRTGSGQSHCLLRSPEHSLNGSSPRDKLRSATGSSTQCWSGALGAQGEEASSHRL
eukprot:2083698-Alexandrium_andersonii.AAC.1